MWTSPIVIRMDPALFAYHTDNSTAESEVRQLAGLASTRVDDSLSAGGKTFKTKVEAEILKKFTHGTTQPLPVRYVGFNIKRLPEGGISMDQDHYVRSLVLPDLKDFSGMLLDDELDASGQTTYRSTAAKLTMLSVTCRPDVSYHARVAAMKYGTATYRDLRDVIKQIEHVKKGSTKMVYPDLGPVNQWAIVGFSDAALKPPPLPVGSVGGQVILLVNTETQKTCVMMWRSRQYAIKSMEDKMLLSTIIEIKEAVCLDKIVQEVRHLPKHFMIADCLTKGTVSGDDLMAILQTGTYNLPGGFVVKRNMGIFVRTWKDLGKVHHGVQHAMWATLRFASTQKKFEASRRPEHGELEEENGGH